MYRNLPKNSKIHLSFCNTWDIKLWMNRWTRYNVRSEKRTLAKITGFQNREGAYLSQKFVYSEKNSRAYLLYHSCTAVFQLKFAVHMGDENSNPTLCGIICHTYTSKMFLVIKKKFPKILRLLEQFLLTVKGQNNFW